MARVSIIGTGNMGQAIAGIVSKSGNQLEVIGENDTDKPVTGDVVVLAVPYGAVADIVARRAEQLDGVAALADEAGDGGTHVAGADDAHVRHVGAPTG